MPAFDDPPSRRALAPAPRHLAAPRSLTSSARSSRMDVPQSSRASVYDAAQSPLPTPPFVFESSRVTSWASAASQARFQSRMEVNQRDHRPYERSVSDGYAVSTGRSSPSLTPSSTGRRKPAPHLSPIDVNKAQRAGRSLSGDVLLVSGSSSDGQSVRKRMEDARTPPLLEGLPPVPPVSFKKEKKTSRSREAGAPRKTKPAPAEEWSSIEPGHRYPSWIEAGHKPVRPKEYQSRPLGSRSISDQTHAAGKTRRSIHDGTVLHDILDTPSWGLSMSERQRFSPSDGPDVPPIPLHHQPSHMHLLGSTTSLGSYMSGTSKASLPSLNPKIKRKQPKRDSVFDRAAALLQARRLRYATGEAEGDGKHEVPSPVELRGVEEYRAREAKRIVDLSDLGEYERKYGMYDRKERKQVREGRRAREREERGGCNLLGMWSARKQRRHEAAMSKEETARQQNRRRVIYAAIVALVFIAIIVIAVVTTVLSKKSPAPTSVTSGTGNATAVSSGKVATATSSAATSSPSNSAYTLASCLSQFASSAPAAPLAYPCDACSPILGSASNDFVAGGTSTGVGAVLQFCGLRELYIASGGPSGTTSSAAAAASASNIPFGWMTGTNVCSGWNGIACDDLGRVTSLSMTYPAIPTAIPASIGNFVSLKSLKLVGNSATPSGPIPTKLFAAANLSTVDIEATSLTGLGPDSFTNLPSLISISLINNAKLGTTLPTLQSSSKLLTLVVTGQALSGDPFASLPSSLTYLDLSYNSLSGTIPDLSRFTSLSSLYLTNDDYAVLPAAFPGSLQTLALASNAKLAGVMPSNLCGSSILSSCDLRGTSLSTGNIRNSTVTSVATRTITSGTSLTTATSTSLATSTGSDPSCGVCKFS